MSERRNNENIRGEPLALDVLLSLAEIIPQDIESASQWWDDNASRVEWEGALDTEPINTTE
ncbi:MAG: hypothetical protein AAF126_26200 [Chloroflexota bacterium]